MTGAGVIGGVRDLYKGHTADNEYDKKYDTATGAAKLGGTAAGAAIGTMILPGIGTLIGGGLGYLAGKFGGKKIAEKYAGGDEAAKKYANASSRAAEKTEELRKEQEKLAQGSLKKHFGDITLGAKEMSTAIQNVLGTGRTTAIDQTTTAMTQMEDAYTALQESDTALRKTTWMAGIQNGAKLAADEVDGLKEATKSYSDSAKQYLTDSQYAAVQSVQLLMGNSESSKSLVESTDKYYGETEGKLNRLTTKLKGTMDSALADGKLDMDVELPKIEELRGKIAKLTSQLAKEDFEADLNILKAKAGAGDLSVESFGELMTGSQAAAEEAAQGYWDAFGQASIGKNEKQKKQLQKGLYDQLSQLQLDVGNMGLDTIRQQYGKELGFLGKDVGSMLQEKTGPEIINAAGKLSESNRAAIGSLMEQLAPTTEQIQGLADNYKALGADVPESITNYLNSAAFYEALSKGPQSVNAWLRKQEFEGEPTITMNPNVELADLNGDGVVSQMEASLAGQTVNPQLLANPIITTEGTDGSGVLSQIEAGMNGQTISPQVQAAPIVQLANPSDTPLADLTSKLQNSFSAGGTISPTVGVNPNYSLTNKFDPAAAGAVNGSYLANTNVDVNAKYNPNKYNVYQGINKSYSASTTVNVAVKYNAIPGSFTPPNPPQAFRGGIFGGGIRGYSNGGMVAGGGRLIRVAEEGDPEMVIPLSKRRKKRGMELWQKAGQYLGVQGYARGGISDGSEVSALPAASGSGVNVNVGSVSVSVPVQGGQDVVSVIRENLTVIAEEIAGEIDAALSSQYSNTPARR